MKIRLEGFVGDVLRPDTVREALGQDNGEELEVSLYTPGGFVYDGMEIANIIRDRKGQKTVVMGALVASIGTYITTAFDKRVVQPNTVFMVHNAMSGVYGDYNEMLKEATELERLNKHIAQGLADRSGKTVEEVLALMEVETYLYGQEIIDAGFADEMLGKASNTKREQAVNAARENVKNALLGKYRNALQTESVEEEEMDKDKAIQLLRDEKVDIAAEFGLNVLTPEKEQALIDQGRQAALEETQVLVAHFGADEADNLAIQYARKNLIKGTPVKDQVENLKKDPIMMELAKKRANITETIQQGGEKPFSPDQY